MRQSCSNYASDGIISVRSLRYLMLYAWKRRCLRNRFRILLTVLATILIVYFLLRTDTIRTILARSNSHGSRLFCIVIITAPGESRFLEYKNISWVRDCYALGIVKYRRTHRFDGSKFRAASPCNHRSKSNAFPFRSQVSTTAVSRRPVDACHVCDSSVDQLVRVHLKQRHAADCASCESRLSSEITFAPQ